MKITDQKIYKKTDQHLSSKKVKVLVDLHSLISSYKKTTIYATTRQNSLFGVSKRSLNTLLNFYNTDETLFFLLEIKGSDNFLSLAQKKNSQTHCIFCLVNKTSHMHCFCLVSKILLPWPFIFFVFYVGFFIVHSVLKEAG